MSATIQQLRDACDSDDIIPHSDDFGGYVALSQEAGLAIYKTLDACIEPTPQRIIDVVKRVAFTIEFFTWDESMKSMGTEECIEAIARHSFAVREMAKLLGGFTKAEEYQTAKSGLS